MTSPVAGSVPAGIAGRLWRWFDRVILSLGREMRLEFLPPLMVYVAYGISGVTESPAPST